MREYESFKRIGTEPHRSYYVPFLESDKPKRKFSIIDRNSSSSFISLDGKWLIKQHDNLDSVNVFEDLDRTIPVPSCIQMHGYDHIQYINQPYPIPVTLLSLQGTTPAGIIAVNSI